MSRIAFCSTHCSGKTSLVKALALEPEFKDYEIFTEKSKLLQSQGVKLNNDSTIEGQVHFLSHRLMELNSPKFISDRSIIDIMGYCLSAQSISQDDKSAFITFVKRFITQYDYIFYVSPIGVAIENNGIRSTDVEYRNQIDFTIKHLIHDNLHLIKNFGIVSGDVQTRIKQVKSYLNF